MKLIILTGAPASGKSSLAKELSKRTSLMSVSKDEFKIMLFEKYGFNSHEEKKKLSKLGEQMLYESIEATLSRDEDIIVDNNFKNFDTIRKIISSLHGHVLIYCINCVADSNILAKRYNDRISSKQRHPALYTLNQYPIIEGVSKFHHIINADDVNRIQDDVKEKIYGDHILEINTNNIDTDFYLLCDRIISFCGLSVNQGQC